MADDRPESSEPTAAHGGALAALDSSLDLIAVLDEHGTIVLTNAAWQASAERRGNSLSGAGRGANYLEVCERSDSTEVASGIRGVLTGARPRYELEYSCHTPIEDAWFALEVLPLGDPRSGALLRHTNITARVAGTRLRGDGHDVDPVTMLPTSPAGVTGLARMLAAAQSRGHSLALVTITLSDLGDIESLHGRKSRDELIVQVVARLLRLTRGDDALVRSSTNELLLFAAVSDCQGGVFLGRRIAEVLESSYLVGATDVTAHASVEVTSSDRFSTLDSLLYGTSSSPVPPNLSETQPARDDNDPDTDESDGDDAPLVPLTVYSIPDGLLQAANEAARSLFGLKRLRPGELHAQDLAGPVDLRSTAALVALSSGTTDSYRAKRTVMTAEGPIEVLTSVRRVLEGDHALAVVLTVPVNAEEFASAADDDPFSAAIVAGTIDANGVFERVSTPSSPMETALVGAFSETLRLAAHPDEADLVDELLDSLRLRGTASGAFRIPHAEQGWVVCDCELFAIRRPSPEPDAQAPSAPRTSYGFVVSAAVSTRSMVDKIVRLERHIRRIASEVDAADLAIPVRPSVGRGVTEVLDSLELTARQRDIVERLALGQRVPSIAAELYISRSTVRNHLAQVYRLVGVHSQDELLNALRAS